MVCNKPHRYRGGLTPLVGRTVTSTVSRSPALPARRGCRPSAATSCVGSHLAPRCRVDSRRNNPTTRRRGSEATFGLRWGWRPCTGRASQRPHFAQTPATWPGHAIQKARTVPTPATPCSSTTAPTTRPRSSSAKNRTSTWSAEDDASPARPPDRDSCAQVSAPAVSGICVLGNLDSSFDPIPPAARGNSISGFRVEHFTGEGDLPPLQRGRHRHARYRGLERRLRHRRVRPARWPHLWNVSHDNSAPGFYPGRLRRTRTTSSHTTSRSILCFGIFVPPPTGSVHGQSMWATVFGDGVPRRRPARRGEHTLTFSHNQVAWANDKG